MFKMDLKKFKKIAGDQHSTTMRHEDGHTIQIAHKALAPKMRAQLLAIPMYDEGGEVSKKKDDKEVSDPEKTKAFVNSFNKATGEDVASQSVNRNQGGEGVPGGAGSPAIDQTKAKQLQDSSQQSGWNPSQMLQNVKEGLGINRKQQPEEQKPQPKKKMAEGGEAVGPTPEEISPGEKLVADKMDYLRTLQPGTYVDQPGKLREDAQDQVLAEQQSAKSSTDVRQAAEAQAMNDKAKSIQAYNESAAKFGLPLKEPDAIPQPGAASAAAMAQMPGMPAPSPQPTQENAAERTPAASNDESQDASTPSLAGGYQQQMQGIDRQAQAQSALGQKQADLYQQQAQNSQNQLNQFQDSFDSLNKERLAHVDDIQKAKIDPEKYWENHSKLAAGLGIILAGFNPKGGPNQALDFVNNNINRSIQAQMKNLDSEHNLLNANLHQFGNLKDATAMTRVMMNDVMANRLDQEIAKAQDPMAKARALQLKGQLQQQAAPMFMELAMRRALIQAGQQGNGQQGSNMEQMLPYLRSLNPTAAKEIESRLVPGVGMAAIPVPDKSREELQGRQSLQEQVHNLRQWSQAHSGDLSPTDMNYGKALANSVQDAYRRANVQGVFREAEANFVKGIVADDPTAFLNKYRTDPKYKALEDSNRMALNGLKKSLGLPQSSAVQELTPQQQSFVAWAKQHPDNPKAQAVLKKLGIQ